MSRGTSGHGKDKTRYKNKDFKYKVKQKHKLMTYKMGRHGKSVIYTSSFVWSEVW